MWSQLNSLAKGIQEQAAQVAQQAGINEHLAHAQDRLGTLSESILDVKPAQAQAISQPSPHRLLSPSFKASPVDLQQGEELAVDSHGGWRSGFDDSLDNSFQPQSLSFAGVADTDETSLVKENEQLRAEVQQVKETASEVLGELEEVKEHLRDAEAAATAKQEQVRSLQASQRRMESRLAAATKGAERAEKDLAERASQLEDLQSQLAASKSAAVAAAAEHQERMAKLEAELAQMREVAMSKPAPLQIPETGTSVPPSPDGQTPPPSTGNDPSTEMKLKLQRAKRTLDSMKKQKAEALAERDSAIARADLLQEEAEKAATLQARLQSLEEERDLLLARVEELKAAAKSTDEIKELWEQLQSTKAEAASGSQQREARISSLEQQAAALNMQLSNASAKSSAELNTITAAREEALASLAAAEESGAGLVSQIAALEAQVLHEDASSMRLQERLQLLEADLGTKQMTVETAQKERDCLQGRNAELKRSSEQQLHALEQLEETCQHLQTQLSAATQQYEAAQQSSLTALEEIEAARHKAQKSDAEYSRLTSKFEEACMERNMLLRQAATLGEQWQASTAPLPSVMDKESRENGDVANGIKSGHSSVCEQGEDLSATLPEHDLQANPLYSPNLDRPLRPSTPPVGGHEGALVALRLEHAAALADLGKQSALVAELQERLAEQDAPGSAQHKSEAETLHLRDSLTAVRRELDESQGNVAELRASLEASYKRLDSAPAESAHTSEAAGELAQQVDMHGIQSQLDTARQEIASLQKQRANLGKDAPEHPDLHPREKGQDNDGNISRGAASTTTELHSLQCRAEAAEERSTLLATAARESEEQLQRARDELDEAHSRAAEFSSQLATAKEELVLAQGEASSSKARLQEIEAELSESDSAVSTLRESLETSAREMEARCAEHADLISAHETAKARVVNLENEVAASQARHQELEDKARTMQRAQEESAGSKEGLQAMLSAQMQEVDRLKEQLSTRENALQAVREGSAAEANMAAAARREAEARAATSEAAVAQLKQDLGQAEDRVEAALQEGRRKQEVAQQRCSEAESRIAVSEARIEDLQQQLSELHAALQAEQEAAAVEARSATAKAAETRDEAVTAAVEEANARAEEVAEALRAQIAEQDQEHKVLHGQLERLRADLEGSTHASDLLATATAEIGSLQGVLAELRAQHARTASEFEAARKSAEEAKTTAAERQKRFNLLNSQFKKRESELVQKAGLAQSEAAAARSELQQARAEAATASQEAAQLRQMLADAHGAAERAQSNLQIAASRAEAAVEEAASARAEAVSLQAALEGERAHNSTATGFDSAELQQRISEAVAEAQSKAEQRVKEAEQAIYAARRENKIADGRATAAELAKIELSMRLAELDDRPPGLSSPPEDDQEERFAASILTKRVTTAEQAAEELREQLDAAKNQISTLEWQISMTAEPQRFGGTVSNEAQSAGSKVLDLFGCANYRR